MLTLKSKVGSETPETIRCWRNFMQEELSNIFEQFARDEFHNSSPLYEQLSTSIAKDPELLSVAAQCRKGERIPNLLFAAVHYLLLKGFSHPVSRFYKSLGGSFDGRENTYPEFRSFCLQHVEQIRQLISVRMVQTNEVSRCVGLMPAFVTVSRIVPDRSLYLVDVGASAGLNLFWDHYGYIYGDHVEGGDKYSPVQIKCSLKGTKVPPIPASFPRVAGRVGLDLNPLDVRASEDALWLRALIWPEHEMRADLLGKAIEVVRQQQLNLLAGDGVDLLPDVMRTVPTDSVLCIVRIFTHLSHERRDRLTALIAEYAAKRDVFMISIRARGRDDSELRLTAFIKSHRTEQGLAYIQNHGQWMEWLDVA
jgi:hypothetical protein